MEDSKVAEYRAAVATYFATANRPYRDVSPLERRLRAHGADDRDAELVTFADALAAEQRVLIVGSPGTGKSTLLDQHAFEVARTGVGTPFFVPLRRYVTNLEDLIQTQIRRFVHDIQLQEIVPDITSGKELVFLLDGYDEVAEPLHSRVAAEIAALTESYPKAQYIMTLRSPGFDMAGFFSLWRVYELAPLSDAEVTAALMSIADESAVRQVFSQSHLLEIARRPLFLHTIGSAIREGTDVRLSMVDAATSYFAWRGHSRSALPIDVPIAAIERGLELLAMEMVRTKSEWIDRSATAALLTADSGLNEPSIMRAVEDTDPVLVDDDRLSFRHKSYLDAYSAKYLRSSYRAGEIAADDLRAAFDAGNSTAILRSLFRLLSPVEREDFLKQLDVAELGKILRNIPEDIAQHLHDHWPRAEPPELVVEALQAAALSDLRDFERKDVLVFAVHGFNTRGTWKNQLSIHLNLETNGTRFIYVPWDYGIFRFGILNPLAYRKRIYAFQSYYNSVLDTYGKSRPVVCAVAHSFGTYIIGSSMLKFSEIQFDRIILVRSVLPKRFPWRKVAKNCGTVLSEIGGSDWALRLAQLVPWLGESGRSGFNAPPSFVVERLNEFGEHSSGFGSRHMREFWIPFLRDGTLP